MVKLSEKLIEHYDQLLGGAVTGQPGEAHDVSVEDTAKQAVNTDVTTRKEEFPDFRKTKENGRNTVLLLSALLTCYAS